MNNDVKNKIINELKDLIREYNLSIDDMIEMLYLTSTWEIILFKKSIDRILKEWKHKRNKHNKVTNIINIEPHRKIRKKTVNF